jgi:hypothetical protein
MKKGLFGVFITRAMRVAFVSGDVRWQAAAVARSAISQSLDRSRRIKLGFVRGRCQGARL